MSMIVLGLAFLGGLFTAWVIGANSASPSFGPVTSAGAVSVFRASFIVGIAALLGAILQGGAVSETVGSGLVSGVTFTTLHAAIILLTASILILGSILFKYPMPTAFTLVGSALGVGIAAGGIPNGPQLRLIAAFWLAIPFAALAIGYGTARGLQAYVPETDRNMRILRFVLLGLGVFTAYTAGANQSGLVVGPLLDAVPVTPQHLLLLAGGGMLVGAWTGSPRIINAVSREYAMMGPRRGIASLLAASTLAQAATWYGVPVSFNEAVIASVIGSGLVGGTADVGGRKIAKTIGAWLFALVAAFAAAYAVTVLTSGTAA